MKVCVFASSSSGNCLLVSQGSTNILLDAGISMRRIVSSLAQAGLTMRDIGGVLITHEHSDHISGLKMLLKHYDVALYAPHTVANRVLGMLPEADGHMNIIPVGEEFTLGAFTVRAFHTSHDTDESVLCDGPYPVYLKRRILSDTGHLSNESCAALARTLAASGTRRVILGHLSQTNNTPRHALAAAEAALAGLDVQLACAPVSGFAEFEVGESEKCCL